MSAQVRPAAIYDAARNLILAGRMSEAETAIAQAESLLRSGDAEAEAWSRSATGAALRSDVAQRMSAAYLSSGDVLRALGHLELAVALGAPQALEARFIDLLTGVKLRQPRAELKPIVARALTQSWIDPSRLARLAARLVTLEPGLRSLTRDPPQAPLVGTDLVERSAVAALRDPLLLTLLQNAIVFDIGLERLMTDVRRALLDLALAERTADDAGVAGLEPVAAALAHQGYANEYAWAWSEAEAAKVNILAARVDRALCDNHAPDVFDVAMVGAYVSLADAFDPERLGAIDWPEAAKSMIRRQVLEPAEEARLAKRIARLTPIADPGSVAVASQYAANPYPRWVSPPARRSPETLESWIGRGFPTANFAGAKTGRSQVLVAGCGTGLETAALASTISDIDILAVDLSLPSLAHAQRRTEALGLQNVQFAQADILEIGRIGRTFDAVVSAGVLHHLDEPEAGLAALKAVTRPGGVMLLALYSRAGRRGLRPAREMATTGGYGTDSDGLRRFRADVLALSTSEAPWRKDLLNRDDLYSLSSLRDLVFHVRETTFDIPALAALLGKLELRFLGFATSPPVDRAFAARFGEAADRLSIEQWTQFEAEVRDAFWGMYHFGVQRL